MGPQFSIPVEGSVDQIGNAQNYWGNGWIGNNFEVELDPFEVISEITICGRLGINSPEGITLTAVIDDDPQSEFKVDGKSFEWFLKLSNPIMKPFKFKLIGDKWLNPKGDEISGDVRHLLILLDALRFSHS